MTDYSNEFKNLQSVNTCLEKKEQMFNSGRVAEIKLQIISASIDEKKILGPELTLIKTEIQKSCDERIQQIQQEQEKDNFTPFDPTFYAEKYKNGSGNLHPITSIKNEILEIFENMGFDVSDGPLVATQNDNFTVLNMPSYHPARAMQDTFYLKQQDKDGLNYVLRTHTTAHQVPYTKSHTPPLRAVFAGQVFRNENIDATHDIIFHQIECLLIDKRVSLSHLKTLIQTFFVEFFGKNELQVRLRPSYFPYTIPSLEIDISNPFKDRSGSKISQQDWIEVGGCGLIHPDVIANMGLNHDDWQGLAFGFGIDRMAQLKLGVSGLGQFFNGHLDFLRGKE